MSLFFPIYLGMLWNTTIRENSDYFSKLDGTSRMADIVGD